MAEHADVISSVSESHGIFEFNIKIADYFINALLLGVSFGGHIGKCRIPSAYLAGRNRRTDFFFFLFRDKGCHLDDFLTGCLLERYSRNHIHVQEIIEYLFHHVIGLANGNVVFLYKDTGNAFFLAEISHRFYFVLGDGTFIDYLFPDKAVSPVHGDISINQIPVLQFGEVVDNGFRTSRSDKYLQSFCTGGFQCLNGRRRDAVSFKTDQCSVYIKK